MSKATLVCCEFGLLKNFILGVSHDELKTERAWIYIGILCELSGFSLEEEIGTIVARHDIIGYRLRNCI
jgi:hypothetical protein